MEAPIGSARSALDRAFRDEAGRLTASLVRLLGDFDLAEEMVAEAMAEAMARWPRDGVPDRPGAWLLTTARRKGIDRLRREARYRAKLSAVAALTSETTREPDDRLRLIFTCCHPALGADAQIALTLRAVVGLTTAEIARAFVVPEATLAKRLTRAKQKIVAAGIAYAAPEPEDRLERLASVLRVVYLVFNEGHLATSGDSAVRRDLALDAEWLAGLLVGWMPEEPEALGLLALIQLHLARWPARLSDDGALVLLGDQDRSRWDRRRIASAISLIERAAGAGRTGPYLLEAAIAAVHCEAPSWEQTDWPQLLVLYSMLAALDPSPVVVLNRAVVLAELDCPETALAEVERLAGVLSRYHPYHATRAVLLRRIRRSEDADEADRAALALTANPGEKDLISRRLSRSP